MNVVSQAEFARMHQVSRAAVTGWKRQGYLRLSGTSVDVAASNAVLASAGKSRANPATLTGRTRRNTANGGGGNAAARDGTDSAGSYAALIDSGAYDLAKAALVHLPLATVQGIVAEVVAAMRFGAVDLLHEAHEPPAGCASWAEHPWFDEPALKPYDWAEAESEAAKIRRPRGKRRAAGPETP